MCTTEKLLSRETINLLFRNLIVRKGRVEECGDGGKSFQLMANKSRNVNVNGRNRNSSLSSIFFGFFIFSLHFFYDLLRFHSAKDFNDSAI